MRDDALDLFPVSPSEQEERPVRAVMRTLLAPMRPVEAERSAPVRPPIGMRPVEALLTLGTLEALEAEPPLIVPPPDPVSSRSAPSETSTSVLAFPSKEPARHEPAPARRTPRSRPASRYGASGAPATRRLAWAIAACLVVAMAVIPATGGDPAHGVSGQKVAPQALRAPDASGGASGKEARVLGSALATVRPGESLWAIAERNLGDPTRWRTIWKANRGRRMTTGERLTDPGLIRPGWRLRLPRR